MSLKSFEHVLIFTEDLEASHDFYVNMIGLRVGWRPDFPFPGYWLYLGESACIHLALSTSIRNPGDENTSGEASSDYVLEGQKGDSKGTGRIAHVAFNADNIEEFLERFEKAGVPARRERVPKAPLQQIFIEDPNGVQVELNFPLD
jgi:catechol 2,3-dioxygenase-like lactoylglutathione lyase family enzyme